MPPQVPTSFIPKKPLDTGAVSYHESGGVGFLFFIALFIFIASLVAAGGVFAWKNYLSAAIGSDSKSLQEAEGAFDPSTINDLVRLDSRINNAETLLQSHVAPSAIFNFLSQQTLQNVQFTSFTYALQADNSASIVLQGQADSFSTVALQSDQFSASTMLKDVVFSSIQTTTGGVSFSVTATVDPSLINYAKNLGNEAAPAEDSTGQAPAVSGSTGSPQATQ
jgi:hypothetical protein